jgi:hypothetical protein
MHPSRQITLSSCPRIKHSRESTNRRPCALSRTGVQRITIRTRVITDLSGPARKVLGLHTPAPSPVPIQGQLLASRTVRSPCRGRILTGVTRGRFQTPRTDDFLGRHTVCQQQRTFGPTPTPIVSGAVSSFQSLPIANIPNPTAVLQPGPYWWFMIIVPTANPSTSYADMVLTLVP